MDKILPEIRHFDKFMYCEMPLHHEDYLRRPIGDGELCAIRAGGNYRIIQRAIKPWVFQRHKAAIESQKPPETKTDTTLT